MVFATDFDPYDELERTSRSNAERLPTVTHSTVRALPVRPLSNGGVGSPARNHPTNYQPAASSVEQAAAQRTDIQNAAARKPVEDNVVPLHWGEPATRVRIENKSLLLPRQPKLPLGLQLLNRVQQGSAVIMGVLVTGALVVYGSTVYVDKSTSRALVQLDELQGESQQLTTANESIKQSLAEQAIREDSGLEPYKAGDVLLLTPAPRRPGAAPEEPAPELPGPLGY
ncbi:MAG: hypothetical protein AB8B99_21870 [Phormidesmis sp.]